MTLKPFSELEFRQMTLETNRGDIHGIFTELRLDVETMPDGLIPYAIQYSDDNDSVPAAIKTHVSVNYFGAFVVNEPLDFGSSDHIEILEWGFDEEDRDDCPEWVKGYLLNENMERRNDTGGHACEPIGLETQLLDALEGADKDTQDSVRKKVEYTTTNVDKIHKINGSKVYNVTIDKGDLRYNLKNTGAYPQKYYYPIQYATIEFKE